MLFQRNNTYVLSYITICERIGGEIQQTELLSNLPLSDEFFFLI